MRRDPRVHLLDVLDAAQAILDFTNGRSRDAYDTDYIASSVGRGSGVRGGREALNRLRRDDTTLAARIPDAQRIIGLAISADPWLRHRGPRRRLGRDHDRDAEARGRGHRSARRPRSGRGRGIVLTWMESGNVTNPNVGASRRGEWDRIALVPSAHAAAAHRTNTSVSSTSRSSAGSWTRRHGSVSAMRETRSAHPRSGVDATATGT